MDAVATVAIPDTWAVLLPVMVGAALTLIAPTAGFVWARIVDFKKDKVDAAHVALCAALALERFAVMCWPVSYSGHEHAERTGQPIREDMPGLEDIPAATDWKGMDVNLADAVMSFHNRIDVAEVIAAHAHSYEHNSFAFETEVLAKGREAWILAERLRRAYDLPPQTELRKSLSSMLD